MVLAFSPDPLKLVLLGMPDAGKSSLLGALAQAGQNQEHLLEGHLKPFDDSLPELCRHVYENQLPPIRQSEAAARGGEAPAEPREGEAPAEPERQARPEPRPPGSGHNQSTLAYPVAYEPFVPSGDAPLQAIL